MKLNVIEPWYAEGLSFTCTQCGNCCTGAPGYVWISDEEIGRLARHLNLTEKETIERYGRKIGDRISLQERRSPQGLYDCIFLKADERGRRTCTVYPVRPLQCRTWPFWHGNLASSEMWKLASHRCPGIDQGKRYTSEQIEQLRDAKDWP
jgi:Fe-S-cluster containining protein